MDTTPFNYINVCGYSGLKVVQLSELAKIEAEIVKTRLAEFITTAIYSKYV
jgi:lipoate-protein ligase B